MAWTAIAASTITWSGITVADSAYSLTEESSSNWSWPSSTSSAVVSITTADSITTSVTTSSATFEDTYNNPGGSDISLWDHTPDSGLTGYDYNIQALALAPDDGYDFLVTTFDQAATGEPTGAYARATTDVGDSSITIYASFRRLAVSVGDMMAGIRLLVSNSASSTTNRDSVDIFYYAADGLWHIVEYSSDNTVSYPGPSGGILGHAFLYMDGVQSTWPWPTSSGSGIIVNLYGSNIRMWVTNPFTPSSYTTTAQYSVYSSTGEADYVYSLVSDRNDGNHKWVGILSRGNPVSGAGTINNLYIESDTTSLSTSGDISTSTSTSFVNIKLPTGTSKSYGAESPVSYLPTRMKPFPDGDGGVDFLVTVQRPKTFLVSSDRPINIASRSAISSNFTAEGRP